LRLSVELAIWRSRAIAAEAGQKWACSGQELARRGFLASSMEMHHLKIAQALNSSLLG
jgi:hypothetical protein